MIQRLKSQGVHCESFPFTATSTGRLGQSLHLALRNRLLWLPNDEALLSELARVRLRETGIGQARLDHDSGDHDDQAVAIAILVAELIGNTPANTLRDWFELDHPTHSCGQPNPRAAVECMKCHERLTPKEPEPVAEQPSPPWTPWTPIPNTPENPQTAAALRLLEEARDPFRQQFSRRG
jgi:hypothetical protein